MSMRFPFFLVVGCPLLSFPSYLSSFSPRAGLCFYSRLDPAFFLCCFSQPHFACSFCSSGPTKLMRTTLSARERVACQDLSFFFFLPPWIIWRILSVSPRIRLARWENSNVGVFWVWKPIVTFSPPLRSLFLFPTPPPCRPVKSPLFFSLPTFSQFCS